MLLSVSVVMILSIHSAMADSIYFQDSMIKEVFAEVGSALSIACDVPIYLRHRIKPFELEWYDEVGNNMQLLNDSSYSIHQSDFDSIVFFNVTEKRHSGIYICHIKSADMNDNKIYEVFIESSSDNRTNAREVKIKDVRMLNVTDSSVLFGINTTEKAEEIVAICIEELEKTVVSRKFNADDEIIIMNLIPGGRYKCQFLARPRRVNIYPWTKVYTVELLPGVPEVIFCGLKENAVEIEWVPQILNPYDLKKSSAKYLLSYSIISLEKTNERSRFIPSQTKYLKTEYTDSRSVYQWKHSECMVNIEIPACFGSNYTISNLQSNAMYEIQLKARNSVGYGKAFQSKVRIH